MNALQWTVTTELGGTGYTAPSSALAGATYDIGRGDDGLYVPFLFLPRNEEEHLGVHETLAEAKTAAEQRDTNVVAWAKHALDVYSTSPLTKAARHALWQTVQQALVAAGFPVFRSPSSRADRQDRRQAGAYEAWPTDLSGAERIHLLYLTAPVLTDPEWPSLLAEIVEEAGAPAGQEQS